jgi:hypothetical protein
LFDFGRTVPNKFPDPGLVTQSGSGVEGVFTMGFVGILFLEDRGYSPLGPVGVRVLDGFLGDNGHGILFGKSQSRS